SLPNSPPPTSPIFTEAELRRLLTVAEGASPVTTVAVGPKGGAIEALLVLYPNPSREGWLATAGEPGDRLGADLYRVLMALVMEGLGPIAFEPIPGDALASRIDTLARRFEGARTVIQDRREARLRETGGSYVDLHAVVDVGPGSRPEPVPV